MEGFVQITAPLRDLIKQEAPFQRTPECQRAFERSKDQTHDRCGTLWFSSYTEAV